MLAGVFSFGVGIVAALVYVMVYDQWNSRTADYAQKSQEKRVAEGGVIMFFGLLVGVGAGLVAYAAVT